MARSLVIVESATKAPTINRYLGRDFTVKSSAGHVRDLPVGGRRPDPKALAEQRAKEAAKTRKLSPAKRAEHRARRNRAQLVQRMGVDPPGRLGGHLRGDPRQGEGGRRTQAPGGARRAHLLGHGPGPRGRGHRLAPDGSAWRAAGPLPARGVQRDHPPCRRAGVRQPRQSGREPRQRPAGAALSGPRGGLRAVAAAVGQGGSGALRRAGAVRRRASDRGPRAGDPRLRSRRYWECSPTWHGAAPRRTTSRCASRQSRRTDATSGPTTRATPRLRWRASSGSAAWWRRGRTGTPAPVPARPSSLPPCSRPLPRASASASARR